MGISERVVVITGATGGLGRVVARSMAEAGARLVLVSSNAEKLQALKRDLNLNEAQALTLAVDLSLPEAARAVLEAVVAKFGRADALLHFVGGWIGGSPVDEVAGEDISKMLQQHLWTTFYMAQVFSAHMAGNGWGRMIIVSSPSAASPPANGAPYAIGKAAQETLMLTLAEEHKGTGVTFNVLRVRAIDVEHKRDAQPSPKTASWTTPEEIAAAILYLCSQEAGRINGARVPLYGSP
jgi:NAD(P)-dependent dehydrogenase (short-subunit alcohol dehydrogenase family)